MQLLVNIDHVATLRNARDEGYPDIVEAARVCEDAGARGIVFHLREDRRHIRDNDVTRLKQSVRGLIDFEMAATDEMLRICSEIQPDLSTLVPEKRQELTTEGGLQMGTLYKDFEQRVVPFLKKHGVAISLFIDPVLDDVKRAADLGVEAVELHTGTYANASTKEDEKHELGRLVKAGELAHSNGLQVNAGHGLDFENTAALIKAIPFLHDVSIGHALICDALFNGLANSVHRMAAIIHGN
ncbi:MAG TPA: pyridoxine 5'-phosphate synthase [Balneolales bacterium]|nr:pyridoxine 5'-phosphate synthase [Balneolales bacterium]